MSDSWTLVLPGMVPPSLNMWNSMHHMKRYRMTQEWRYEVWKLVNYHRVYPCEKMHLDCKLYFRTNRGRDTQNYLATLDKLFFDSLTERHGCGIIHDDSSKHLTWTPPELFVDPANPRTEVTLTPTF